MTAEGARTIRERYPDFDPASFQPGDVVSYYFGGEWQFGRLLDPIDADGGRVVVRVSSQPDAVELRVPPKKLELTRIDEVKLDGKHFRFNPDYFYLDENGNALFDLDPVGDGQRILGVDAAILREYELTSRKVVDSDVSADVGGVVGMKRKELLARQLELEKNVQGLMSELGPPSDWPDLEAQEIKDLQEAVRETAQEIEKITLDLRREVGGVGKVQETREKWEQAKAQSKRLEELESDELGERRKEYDKKVAERERWRKTRAEFKEYQKKKAAFDKFQSGGGGGGGKKGGGGQPPEDPGPPKLDAVGSEPDEPLKLDEAAIRDGVAFDFFTKLAGDHIVRKEVEKRRKKEAADAKLGTDFSVGDLGGTDEEKKDARLYRKKTVEILRQVLAEWKVLTVEAEAKFDFDKEKKEMLDKIVELRHRNEKVGIKDVESGLAEIEEGTKIGAFNKDYRFIIDWVLELWDRINKIELRLFEGERALILTEGRDVVEREIDVPQALWRDVLDGRDAGIADVLREAYASAQVEEGVKKEAIRGALRQLFARQPDENLLKQLRQYGIKSWEHFRRSLDAKFGEKLSATLHEMAQDHLRREAARSFSVWQNAFSLRDPGAAVESWRWGRAGAMRAQALLRSATNLFLVGGSATFLMALVSGTGGARAVGSTSFARELVAPIGGAIGGAVSAVWDRFFWGRKTRKDKTAAKVEELKADRARELSPDLARDQADYFPAILAQTAREASIKPVAEGGPEEAKQLAANARQQYERVLKDAEMAGQDVTVEQKKDLAIALLNLQAETRQRAEASVAVASPAVLRMLTGDKDTYSGKEIEDKSVWLCALNGAVAGLAISGDAKLAGAMLGSVAGGLHGDQTRKRVEFERGVRGVEEDYQSARRLFNGRIINNELRNLLAKFKAALKGGEAGKSEQWYVMALRENQMLRARVENLVYEMEQSNELVDARTREDLGMVLGELERRIEMAGVEARDLKTTWDTVRGHLRTVRGAAVGAVAGLTAAWIGGGISEGVRHVLQDWFGITVPPIKKGKMKLLNY